ncbi:hypothetical protein SUGI_0404890 [Cryptomeria japonica]|uniref:protein TIME FOR COFFEE isoform X2 n=1 Tax=Cryptomeria japonica TaxID=3369 RepID=UPI002408D43E|nr:protein TIME FOR COFFEE isoform X2 [Cryptomeria japonica]GLJ21723.1 hypothetical protein SUGI_0404890 [Cryptomeria japonica]
MDRGRDSRRGGGGSGAGAVSGHVASRRRPRSGFKDSSAVCEEEEGLNESHDSTRLRERSSSAINNSNNHKKERSSLSSSKNKRRRPGLPERFHGGGRDRDRDRDNEEVDESSEESPVEEEEEDDDEPPHRPLPNPRRTTKFKSQWKVSEETIGVGLDSVPRKARSASVKRPHDSSSSAVLLTSVGVGVSDGSVHRRQKSPSPAGPSVVPASPSSSNASVKPGKRMKPIGTKPRPSKMVKMSSSISEREVEVAEVLFGLTRQFHNHHPAGETYAYSNANASKPDAKDSSNDGSVPPIYKVSSPLPSSSVVSSPISTSISPPPSSAALTLPHHSTSAPTPPTAPKKKRPRPAKPEEASSASVMRPPVSVSAALTTPSIASGARNDIESGYQHVKMETSSVNSEPDAFLPVINPKGITSVATTTCSSSISTTANQVSTPLAPSNQTDGFIASEKTAATKYADLKSITTEKTSEAKIPDLRTPTENIADGHSTDLKVIPNDKQGGANSADAKFVTNENTVEPKAVESHSDEKSQFDASEDFKKSMTDVSEDQPDQIVKKELDVPDSDLSSCPDKKMGIVNKLTQTPKAESIVEEKFKIDLMAPPEKSSFDTDDDSLPVAVSHVTAEVPEGTGVTVISEIMAVAVKEERQSNKWEEELKVEKTENKYDTRDEGGEKLLQKKPVIEQRGIDLQLDGENLDNVSNKLLPQKQSRTLINEPKIEKEEKSVSEGVMGSNVCASSSVVTSMPISMTVPGWPPLGYFAPAAANWAGASSLPGVLPIEGTNSTPAIQPPYILQKSRPSWKRCATHSYIAHFIECQLRMSRHSFWPPANFFASRQYNLNAPLPPSSEFINLGSSVSGTVSAASAGNNASVSRGLESVQDKSIGLTALSSKEKTSNYVDARRKQTSHQQATQQISSTSMQPGHGFVLSASQSGAVGGNSSTAGSIGNVGSLVKNSSTAVEAVPSAGAGPANSNLAGMSADAQYVTMLQNGYSFAIPHFGSPYGGASSHIGQQQAQFFNAPSYTTQLLHPPQSQPQPQSQRQGPQNPSTSSGSSSSQQHKQQFQGSRNFSSSQKQQQQGTPSPSPSNSQQQHHMPMTQARHIDREANNEGDSPSTADSRLPVSQKTFYSPASPTSSNYSATPTSLLAQGLPIQTQDLALFPPSGGKHNGKQQQPQFQYQVASGYNLQQLGNDPTFQMKFNLSPSQVQAFAMNQTSNILCVPPMAQGHAMITDPARHQIQVQAQQHAVQPGGTQPQHSGQMQRTQTISTGDGRNSIDSMSNASGRGRDDERKSTMKGGMGHSLHFSRFETENSANIHGSPTDGSLPAALVTNNIDSMSRTLNAIPSAGNGSRNSRPTSSSSQGSPHLPSTQQLNPNTKQTASRVKTMPSPNVLPSVTSAQITMPSYGGDRTPPNSNLSKFPASMSYQGQNMKQGQQSPQWKMSSRTPMPPTMAGVGASAQAIHAAEMKSSPQQGRNQHSNTNTGGSAVCSPQASFVTSSKNSGQAPMNSKNNCTPIVAPKLSSSTAPVVGSIPMSSSSPVSKSVGSPASRSPTGSKGPVSQQKPAVSTSNKKSSPVGSRNMPSVLGPSNVSQSSSGKSGQQQYQQQSMPAMASGQSVNLKNQQYLNQPHCNQQPLIFQHTQYLSQQAVQQSQHSAQTAHQVTGFHQKQQLPGSNSPQPAFNTAHLRQQVGQQQQMQLASSASSTPSMFPLGTLTLGGTSGGSSKANPSVSLGGNSKGNMMLHAQCSGQQQLGNTRAMLASSYMQAMSSKSSDQRVVADVLSQEPINGNRMLQNSANLCSSAGQNRSPFNTSPQAASIHVPPGSLKKSGGSAVENLNSGGLSLSMAPSSSVRTNPGPTGSGSVGQNSAGMHSNQMPPMSIHQPPVPLAGGPATSASPGLHGQTAASVVQP